jgi:hypothetical protein
LLQTRIFTTRSGKQLPFTSMGFGTAPLGNLFEPISDGAARATLDAAWEIGCRNFDTAPFYGLGIAETRLNPFLRQHRDEPMVLSTKIGRLLRPCARDQRSAQDHYFDTPAREVVFDYSYDGVMRSFDFSMERFRKKFKDYPGMEDLLDEVEVDYIGERKHPLHVSPDDVCVATVWYSAHFAKKISDFLGGRRFLYLVQDYEPNFFPGGALFALADETYSFDYAALFSTSPLHDSFRKADIGGFASRGVPGISFDNACSASLAPREQFLAMNSGKPKRKLVFYSRPIVDRNMFNLAALSLITAYEQGIFDPAEWECIGMGLGDALLELLPGVFSTSLPRMTLREYEQTVGQFDVCLTLMASPHPSLIPMDCAGSGAIVVTNTFRTKTDDYLRGLCGNIIPVAPSVPEIVDGLARAVAASADLEARHRRATAMAYPRTWEESLTPRHAEFVTEHVLAPALAGSGRPRRRAMTA